MRALMIALLMVLQLAGVAWSGESIISGDADHDYLPTWNEREVLLHRFDWNPGLTAPAAYSFWSTSFGTVCMGMYKHTPSSATSQAVTCSLAEGAFRAPRMFTLTRVTLRSHATGLYTNPVNGWAQSEYRVVAVSTSGTVTEIGAAQAFEGGGGTVQTWNLDQPIAIGEGVSLQVRATLNLALDDYGTFPTIEFWGIWK